MFVIWSMVSKIARRLHQRLLQEEEQRLIVLGPLIVSTICRCWQATCRVLARLEQQVMEVLNQVEGEHPYLKLEMLGEVKVVSEQL